MQARSSPLGGMTLGEAWRRVRLTVDRLIVWGNREPVLTIRRVWWIVTGGLPLFLLYLAAAVGTACTIVFLPFAPQVVRIGWFALDGGITLEPYIKSWSFAPSRDLSFLENPAHPYTIAGNVAWAILFGWALTVAHLATALVQAVSVVGIPTAITNVQLASYVIWPFGRCIRDRALPTTLDELLAYRQARRLEESTERVEQWA